MIINLKLLIKTYIASLDNINVDKGDSLKGHNTEL